MLDDGWFRHRRDDTAGLGDWYVDEDVWPDGLHPIVDHVRGLGHAVRPLVRAGDGQPRLRPGPGPPGLAAGRRPADGPARARHQHVLDLANPLAFDFLLERLDALVAEYDIGYLKWDHNRDLHRGATGTRAAAGRARADHGGLPAARRAAPRGTPAWRSSRAPAAAPGSTSASWSAPTGSGPRTPTTRSSGSRSSAGPGCCCRPSWSARTSAAPTRTPPAGTPTWLPAWPRRCSGTPGSSGTSPTCTPGELARGRLGRPLQGAAPLLHGGHVVRADPTDDGTLLHGVVAQDWRVRRVLPDPLRPHPRTGAGLRGRPRAGPYLRPFGGGKGGLPGPRPISAHTRGLPRWVGGARVRGPGAGLGGADVSGCPFSARSQDVVLHLTPPA